MPNLTPFLLLDGNRAEDWMHPTRKPRQRNTVAMYVTDGTLSDLKELFDKLSLGDRDLLDELQDMPFGTYGIWLTGSAFIGSFGASGPEPKGASTGEPGVTIVTGNADPARPSFGARHPIAPPLSGCWLRALGCHIHRQ